MRVLSHVNVYDAALDRIRYLFDEFEEVIVTTSGGKDSTVVYNLAMQVAEEKGRLPLKVMFIDQEAEWQSVIEYLRTVMSDERVEPIWLQCPIRLFNATSTDQPWLECWKEGDEWIRPKEENSITENIFGADRFKDMFEAYCKTMYPNTSVAQLSGVRCEESPTRLFALTTSVCYKWITWGKIGDKDKNHYAFYPIYDWGYRDVWKAIHDNKWDYCRLYDQMYQYGIKVRQMRVSNVHHEQAVKSLFFMQEVEPETWISVQERLRGVNSAARLEDDFLNPQALPYMFNSWVEYRDYLLENLFSEKDQDDKGNKIQDIFAKRFARDHEMFDEQVHEGMVKMHIACILAGDYHGTKNGVWSAANTRFTRSRLRVDAERRRRQANERPA